jgi:hypothetical protein
MGIEPSDILFIVMVIWTALAIIDSDWGGGKRGRIPVV